MSGGMFMNSSSSNDSNSDDDKCHLPTIDFIPSDNEKLDERPVVIIRHSINRLRRQQATTSLQSPLSACNNSSPESIDDHDIIVSDQTSIENNHLINQHVQIDLNRVSFNESEQTDSGIGRDSGSSWRLSNYSDLFNPSQQQPSHYQKQTQRLDIQQDSDRDDDAEDNPTPVPQIGSLSRSFDNSLKNEKLQKTGWLHVKHWLTAQRNQKIDLASKRQWKRYWTCLKGSIVYFYTDYNDINSKFSISIVESLCYPWPEHPNRQNVFTLTIHSGDTYCFQATDQSEVDHWIRVIHCNSSINTTVSCLRTKIKEIEENIERETKMRKLADLQLKSSTDQKVRLLIAQQIDLWGKNSEAYHVDLFRNQCYLCALTNDRDLPNPKDLLAQACPSTKTAINKLAAFSPCSFYALVAARRRADHSKWKSKLEQKSFEENQSKNDKKSSSNSLKSPITTIPPSPTVADQTILQMVTCEGNPQLRTIVSISEMATVGELLKSVTEKLGLQIDDHFLHFGGNSTVDSFVGNLNDKLNNLVYSSVEIRRKIMYQITLNQELDASGITIDTELHREYSLQVIVSNVRRESEAERLGVMKGDEIVIVNNVIVQDLDLHTLDNCLAQLPIVLTLRSSRSHVDLTSSLNRSLDYSQRIIQTLICPPPPRRIERLSRQEIRELVVPKPDRSCSNNKITTESNQTNRNDDQPNQDLERLFKNVDELSRYCRPTTIISCVEAEPMMNTIQTPRIKTLSNAQRIRKVIFELVETERSYVQDMQRLIERYIEPLRDDSKLLPADVIESLYISVKSIHQLQLAFLQKLESSVPTEILAYNAVHEFRNILISIAEIFCSYAPYFKLYSTFCAMHLRINRLLEIHQHNQHLKDFLAARNPRHQHSSSFESYLIKPVQRILKYPLLLLQLSVYSNDQTDSRNSLDLPIEITKLKKSISIMNEIGEYMNGMQRLYEDFGQSFEQIIKTYSEQNNKTLQLNLPDLYAYGEIDWVNIHLFVVGKHHQRLKTFCFVFRHGCLLIVREHSAKKKQQNSTTNKGNKFEADRFTRFIPIEEIAVNLINIENSKETVESWQLTEINSKTKERLYFHFSTKDAQTFVKTIENCISSSTPTIEWRKSISGRSITMNKNGEPLSSTIVSDFEQKSSPTRSSHSMFSKNALSIHQSLNNRRRSPSPVWKRRTTPVHKHPLSMHIRRKTIQGSTNC